MKGSVNLALELDIFFDKHHLSWRIKKCGIVLAKNSIDCMNKMIIILKI